MIPKEVLKQIRKIHITTRRMVTDVFAGQYHSVFKGRGMEFDEVRQYYPGDDVRTIDWNVTARTGTPHVKKFIEERELTVMVLIDLSASSYFGTVNKIKRELAAEICSLLTFSAIENNDRVGFIAFTDRIEKFVPPRKGLRHGLRIIREALYYKPAGRKTNITNALEYLNRICRKKAVVFIISDFYDDAYQKALSIVNKRHDITVITITDPHEISLPSIGIISLTDPESGKNFLIDTSNPSIRKELYNSAVKTIEERKRIFNRTGIDSVDIRTDISYTKTLLAFFKMRERRQK